MSVPRVSRIRLVLATVTALALSAGLTANAHDAASYYPGGIIWKTSVVNWRYTPSFPHGPSYEAFESHINWAAQRWTDAQNGPSLSKAADAPSNFNYEGVCQPSTSNKNALHFGTIDGPFTGTASSILAVTQTCVATNIVTGAKSLSEFQMEFDSEERWFVSTTSSSVPVNDCSSGQCQVDLWSIAIHEFGHALGFNGPFVRGHFDPDDMSICDPNDTSVNFQTMCPYYPEASVRQRTLGVHDLHTHNSAYTPTLLPF